MVRLRRKIVHMDSLLLTLGPTVSNYANHHAIVASARKLLQDALCTCWMVQNAFSK